MKNFKWKPDAGMSFKERVHFALIGCSVYLFVKSIILIDWLFTKKSVVEITLDYGKDAQS